MLNCIQYSPILAARKATEAVRNMMRKDLNSPSLQYSLMYFVMCCITQDTFVTIQLLTTLTVRYILLGASLTA